jgi:hypothetical protein
MTSRVGGVGRIGRLGKGFVASLLCLSLLVSLAAVVSAQRRGGRFFGNYLPPNPSYDGAFIFCRIMFDNARNGDGGGWDVDYPRADVNLPFRFSELTTASVSRAPDGDYNHALLRFTDPEIYKCPFVMMTEPGGAYISPEEAAALRVYLDKGGFLWADDFWGEYAWAHWEVEIRKALPSGLFPIVELTPDHPLFHALYVVPNVPQIPSIQTWLGTGQTSERDDSRTPHARAIVDPKGHMMVLMTHNTDFGDAFERETDNRAYFERFAGEGYAFAVNALLYAMSR